MDDWSINWGSLKALKMEGGCLKGEVANVLLGTPSLESLELNPCGGGSYAIASKSLKILILEEVGITDVDDIEISCPNLEELSIKSPLGGSRAYLPDEVIENVVSSCLFLRSLELDACSLGKLVIASMSLKKLVLRHLNNDCEIEITCPNLEELNSYGFHYERFKLTNIPSLICGNHDSEISQYGRCHEDRAKKIFQQLRNVKELTMESWFIKILSGVEIEGLSYTWSKNKILTLNGPNFEHLPGIMCALRSSRNLERLVIKLQVYEGGMTSYSSVENSWNSNGTIANCLLRHLKTVEIIGLSKQDSKYMLVLNFIKFLLKNAKVLEKLVLMISKDGGFEFAFKVSQKVSSFPRCSQHAIVELLSSQ